MLHWIKEPPPREGCALILFHCAANVPPGPGDGIFPERMRVAVARYGREGAQEGIWTERGGCEHFHTGVMWMPVPTMVGRYAPHPDFITEEETDGNS